MFRRAVGQRQFSFESACNQELGSRDQGKNANNFDEPGDLTTELGEDRLDAIMGDALAGKNPATKAKYTSSAFGISLGGDKPLGSPRAKLGRYVEYLDAKGVAASTINGHLVALREAADAGLIDERTYRRLSRVRVQVMASNHTGN